MSGNPIHDSSGNLAGSFGVITDITERKRAEERILRLNTALHAIRNVNQLITQEKDRARLLEGACRVLMEGRGYFSAWIALIGPGGELQAAFEAGLGSDFQPFAERMKGGRLPECARRALGAPEVVVVASPSADCRDCPLTRRYPERAGMSARLEHGGKVYGVLTVSIPAVAVGDQEEEALFHELAGDLSFALHAIEIEGERKLAAEALRLKNLVFDASIAAESIADTSGVITEANAAFLRTWGYGHKDEVVGRPIPEFLQYPDEAVAIVTGLTQSGEWAGEYTARRKDGSTFAALGLATVLRNEAGELVGYQSAVVDITERKRAEEALRQANDQLEQRVRDRTARLEESNTELEAFSYSVSHDLRAPLRAVDGFTRILAKEYEPHLNHEGKRLCSVIRENTRRMAQLIDDLLAFSRLGRAEMNLSPIDMGAMATALFYEVTTPESRERIDFRVGAVPPATGDPTLMRQAWLNLLANAVKFSSKRARAVIEVRGEQRDGEAVYSVTDDGAGFDMQYVDKLFGVFQRLHSTSEFEGNGVGLALVHRVVRRHGGRVWAAGEIDRGATFHFALPQKGA